jgi:ELWxxDGT repeat protein
LKLSLRPPQRLVWALALLLTAGVVFLPAPGARAVPKRGAVLVKDINRGRAGGIQGRSPGSGDFSPQLASVSGGLYFSANDGEHGYELWQSNGARKGTWMVKDINPGPAGSMFSIVPSSSSAPFYFRANDGVHGAELWRSDSPGAGTTMVADLNPGPGGGGFGGELINLAGALYFPFRSPPDPLDQGLWRSDGTALGTTMVKQIIGIRNLTEVGGTLYFGGAGDDPTFKIGLWRSDGTTAGTTNVKEGTVPTEITDVGGTLYLAVADGALTGLWRSDGTEAGTVKVKTIIDSAGGSALPRLLTEVNGTLYFIASTGMHFTETDELWRSDGTEAGTSLVKRIEVPSGLGSGIDYDLTAFRGKLYFTAGGALWRSDGTPQGTTVVKGTGPPGAKTPKRYLAGLTATAADGTLYLVGSDKRHGPELWRSDGTRKGTKMVRDIRPGPDSSLPMYLTAVGRTLFFSAKDGRHGRELWKVTPRRCSKPVKGKCKRKG